MESPGRLSHGLHRTGNRWSLRQCRLLDQWLLRLVDRPQNGQGACFIQIGRDHLGQRKKPLDHHPGPRGIQQFGSRRRPQDRVQHDVRKPGRPRKSATAPTTCSLAIIPMWTASIGKVGHQHLEGGRNNPGGAACTRPTPWVLDRQGRNARHPIAPWAAITLMSAVIPAPEEGSKPAMVRHDRGCVGIGFNLNQSPSAVK